MIREHANNTLLDIEFPRVPQVGEFVTFSTGSPATVTRVTWKINIDALTASPVIEVKRGPTHPWGPQERPAI